MDGVELQLVPLDASFCEPGIGEGKTGVEAGFGWLQFKANEEDAITKKINKNFGNFSKGRMLGHLI